MRIFGATTSSGGGGTVQTDGVTIQGNGSSGSKIALLDAITDGVTLQGAGISASKLALKAVQTDGTLTGAGTVASPLSVVSNPLTFFQAGGIGNNQAVPQNQTTILGFAVYYPISFSKLYAYFSVADAGANSDYGIYTPAGSLIANVGAQHISTAFGVVINTVQGLQTIQPGLYIFAATTAGTALTIGASFSGTSWVSGASAGATSGGALGATISAPARAVGNLVMSFALTT